MNSSADYEIEYKADKSGYNNRKYDAGYAKSCDEKDERKRGKSNSFSDLNDRDILHVLVNAENSAEHTPDAAHQERNRH